MIRVVAILCVIVVALNVAEALVTRITGGARWWYTAVEVLVFVGYGFALRRYGERLPNALVAGAVGGLVEQTIGDWVTSAILRIWMEPVIAQVFLVPIVIVVGCCLCAVGFALGGLGRAGHP